MQILVAVKWVPAPESVAFDPVLNRINRHGVAGIVNPLDWGAVDAALTLRGESGGRVTAVTMGPPDARAALEAAIGAGADAGIHLCDPAFAGADTLATARALAEVFRATSADVFLFGANTLDGGTAQTAAQVAAITGAAGLTEAWELATGGGRGIAVVRHREGDVERWSVPLPAVISVARRAEPRTKGASDPAASIESWDADRLGLDPGSTGIRGSVTYVQKITPVPRHRAGRTVDPAEAAESVAAALRPAAPTPAPAAGDRVPEVPRCSLWALAEIAGECVHPSSLEGLTCLRSVAGALGAEVISVALEQPAGPVAAQVAAAGADRLLVATAPGLQAHHPQEAGRALAALARRERPFAVLGPWSAWGRQCLAMAAAELETGLTGDFVGLDVSPRPGDPSLLDLVWLKPAWSGTALARVVARATPAMGTLRPRAIRPRLREDAQAVPVQLVSLPAAAGSGSRAGQTSGHTGDGLLAAMETAEVVIAVGSGIDPASLEAAERWAAERGWALAGTRRAVEAGRVPAYRELSIAVRSLSPRVFIGAFLDEPADLLAVRGAQLVAVLAPPDGLAGSEYDARVTGQLGELLSRLAAALGSRPASTLAG